MAEWTRTRLPRVAPVPKLLFGKEVCHGKPRRVYADCRDFPTAKPCSLYVSGSEDEVLETEALHAVRVHGEKDTPDLRQKLRSIIKEERSPGVGVHA